MSGARAHRAREIERIRIRPGRPSDAEACSAIETRCAEMFRDSPRPEAADDPPVPPESFRQAAWAGRLIVAERDGALAGLLVWATERDSVHLCELDVDPPHQQHGVARSLIAAAGAAARRIDRDALTLTTYADVPWNAPYYARLGFEILTEPEWTPECRAELQSRADAGHDVSTRVAMILRL